MDLGLPPFKAPRLAGLAGRESVDWTAPTNEKAAFSRFGVAAPDE